MKDLIITEAIIGSYISENHFVSSLREIPVNSLGYIELGPVAMTPELFVQKAKNIPIVAGCFFSKDLHKVLIPLCGFDPDNEDLFEYLKDCMNRWGKFRSACIPIVYATLSSAHQLYQVKVLNLLKRRILAGSTSLFSSSGKNLSLTKEQLAIMSNIIDRVYTPKGVLDADSNNVLYQKFLSACEEAGIERKDKPIKQKREAPKKPDVAQHFRLPANAILMAMPNQVSVCSNGMKVTAICKDGTLSLLQFDGKEAVFVITGNSIEIKTESMPCR